MNPDPTPKTPERALSGLVRLSVDRPVGVAMIAISLVVFGALSFERLPLELMPPIQYPTLTIRTEYPGAAPEDVERHVTIPIEEAVGVVSRLVSIESWSRAEVSIVRLEFTWGTDMDRALLDLREKLNEVRRELASEAEKPLILLYDPRLDPILTLALFAKEDATDPARELVALKSVAEDVVKRELSRVEGVASVEVEGGLEEEIRIDVDVNEAAKRSLDLEAISRRLAAENVNLPAGEVYEGETRKLVRALNEFKTQDEISNLVLAHAGGADVRLSSLARVTRVAKEREVAARVGGRRAVLLEVFKEGGANLVDVATRVRERLVDKRKSTRGRWEGRTSEMPSIAERIGDDYELAVLSDRSVFIADATREVETAALFGGALAIVVLFLFLKRLGSTVLIAASIPLSVLVTFAPMLLGGVSLNVMSLGGLALGIGMLVDNSIVVLESIHRCREEGDPPRQAAIRGTSEVASAVIASTLTTLAVFVPLVYVSGVAGQLFRDQALTVVYSLAASLVVALTVIPMLSARSYRLGAALPGAGRLLDLVAARGLARSIRSAGRYSRAFLWPYAALRFLIQAPLEIATRLVAAVLLALVLALAFAGKILLRSFETILAPLLWAFDKGVEGVRSGYARALRLALEGKWALLVAVVPLAWFAHRSWSHLGSELLPPLREGEFKVEIELAPGTPVDRTDLFVAPLARELGETAGVERVFTRAGVEPTDDEAGFKGPHTVDVSVVLAPGTPAELEEAILERIRDLCAASPEVASARVTRPTLFTLEAPVAVVIQDDDRAVLERVSETVAGELRRIEGLTEVETSLRRGDPELLLYYDPERLVRYQLGTRQVAERVRRHVHGEVSTRFREGEKKIDVRVRRAREIGDEAAMVELLPVTPPGPLEKRLSEVARLATQEGPGEIRHVDGRKAAVVTAAIHSFDLGTLAGRVRDRLRELDTGGAEVRVAGQNLQLEESRKTMLLALSLAIFLVYVVMASQFESLRSPFAILLTVPLAAIGIAIALDLLSIPLSILVYTGAIVLAGVVVNNAIVLVDYAAYLETSGISRREALIRAGSVRLRPILMTTLTTVVGLLPMTGWIPVPFQAGQGAELRAPLAITILVGLSFSTLLTLFVVPVAYELLLGRERPSRP